MAEEIAQASQANKTYSHHANVDSFPGGSYSVSKNELVL